MLAVLALLAPTYLEAYQLRRYAQTLEAQPAASDDAIRTEVVKRAHQLDLPVKPSDVQITHDSGKVHVKVKYAIQMDLGILQVDIHP